MIKTNNLGPDIMLIEIEKLLYMSCAILNLQYSSITSKILKQLRFTGNSIIQEYKIYNSDFEWF